jgi:hypothetical protein
MHIILSLCPLLLTNIHSKVSIVNHNQTDPTSLRWCIARSWLRWKMCSVAVHSYIHLKIPSSSIIFVPCNVFAPGHHAQISLVHSMKFSRWKTCSVVFSTTKLHSTIQSHVGDPTHQFLLKFYDHCCNSMTMLPPSPQNFLYNHQFLNETKLTLLGFLSFCALTPLFTELTVVKRSPSVTHSLRKNNCFSFSLVIESLNSYGGLI